MYKVIPNVFLTLFMAVMLTACGGGGGGGSASTTSTNSTSAQTTETIYQASKTSYISWTAPTTYENGAALSPAELAGFKIYTGSTENSMRLTATITDITLTKYSFESLSTGIHYISVTSFDINGIESKLSTTIVVNIS